MKRIAVDSTFVQFDQVKYILHTETVDKCIEIHLKLFVDKTGKRIMICLQRLCHLFQRKFRIQIRLFMIKIFQKLYFEFCLLVIRGDR